MIATDPCRSFSKVRSNRKTTSETSLVKLAYIFNRACVNRRAVSNDKLESEMFVKNGIEYEFHHMGIPTLEKMPGERYSSMFGMYTSNSNSKLLRIQWHRFDGTSPLHPLLRSIPHVALKVSDLERAVEGCILLLAPYEPVPGYRVAIIQDGDVPIELVQTSLTDEELWERAETESILYTYDTQPAL